MINILLFTPISSHKDYALSNWLLNLNCIEQYYKSDENINLDILLIDNSQDPNYHNNIYKNSTWTIKHINPNNREIKYIVTECQEYARQYAVQNNYEYMFSLECDIHPPIDILHSLIHEINQNSKIRVISAPYYIGLGIGSHYLIEHIDRIISDQSIYIRTYCRPLLDSLMFIDGTIKVAYGSGIGCMLIHKEVYSKIKFRLSATETGPSDKFLNKDMYNLGYKKYVHTGISIYHDNTDWKQYANYNEKKDKI
jgi:hypothetical protein